MATVVSVNGQDGATLARSTGIRIVDDGSQALVVFGAGAATKDGKHGRNAPQAVRGGPAGILAVQLSQSTTPGGILVERLEHRSAQNPPRRIEVPVGRDLVLTAVGGRGENGQNGGDGQRGQDGVDGTGATEGSDATNGTDGGRGGDAGRGSSGGDGGHGGTIHIIMNQHETHLLMATTWDVRGGEGGRSGAHGSPGAGGQGGQGGQGWRWEEIIGYKPFCTSSCIGDEGSSSALTRHRSQFGASSQALVAQTRALTVSGNNLQSMIAQTAAKYNASRQPRADAGACKCKGGRSDSSCAGCDMKPIVKTFRRAPGLVGKEGRRGTAITTPLGNGNRGETGEVFIAVSYDDGSTQTYSAPWALELVDFEVEDENGDGVFEPGEHLFIRRVTVRNVGGMPSPTCRIPVTLNGDTEWFAAVPVEDGGQAFLPTSIPSGESASMEGAIKVRIKERPPRTITAATLGSPFSTTDRLSIRADMPWLDRRMPAFDFTKEVNISYPCGLGDIRHLSTIAQGVASMVRYEVLNLSNRPLGVSETNDSGRFVEVRSTVPVDVGRLINEEEEVEREAYCTVPFTRPKDTLQMHQQFRVSSTARNHTHFQMTFELYIDPPRQTHYEEIPMVLIERRIIRLQVSSIYTPGVNSAFVLVTNPRTTEEQSLAIQHFIRHKLRMEMDVCNVHQNGGLLHVSENDLNPPRPLTDYYEEKTLLFLDDSFNFFGRGARTSSQLFDPCWLVDIANKGSSALFLGSANERAFEDIVRWAVSFPPTRLEDAVQKVRKSHKFQSPDGIVEVILEEKNCGTAHQMCAIPIKQEKWYRFGRDKAEKQAILLARFLRDRLPNERFLVTYVSSSRHGFKRFSTALRKQSTNDENLGYILVLPGLPQDRYMVSTESAVACHPNQRNLAQSRLNNLSKYHIVAAVPFGKRVDVLWNGTYDDAFILNALTLSLSRDLLQQVNGLQNSAFRPLAKINQDDSVAIEGFLKTHLPCLQHILNNPQAQTLQQAPRPIVEILKWTFAFTCSMKRHSQVNRIIRTAMQHRPALNALDTNNFGSLLTEYRPENLIPRIAALTEAPEYTFTRGETSASSVVPQTKYCAPGEWNATVKDAADWNERLRVDMESAQNELGRMQFDIEPSPAAELAGADRRLGHDPVHGLSEVDG